MKRLSLAICLALLTACYLTQFTVANCNAQNRTDQIHSSR